MRYNLKPFFVFAYFAFSIFLHAESDLDKAVELRKAENYSEAERLLNKYASPAGFDALKPTEKIDFLNGLLELAHIRALKDDVPGALALLNWAESREDPYQRAIACVKYAEILIDLGEFERASGYLKNADEIISKRATEENTGAAIGQGGEVADTGAAWRELRDDSDALNAEIEAEVLKQKFGATYGNYVKLRRLQRIVKRSRTPRYRKEAMKLADEIMETDPASQFAAAAGYLKGEIFASRLKEESPKKEIREVKDYLDKFIRQQPDGLYRGEALMLLGKISLEIEWDAKDAEKYYAQALEYFRKAREKRDAVSLYAAINDDLKKQSTPTQKPTTLNQWKRTIYHDEDPLKLYNATNAPSWYISDKEKNCLFMLGFFCFFENRYQEAEKYWKNAAILDDNIMKLKSADYPNALARLIAATKNGKMAFTPEEKNTFKNAKNKLLLQFTEMNYMLEKFDAMPSLLQRVLTNSKSTKTERAAALLGMGLYHDMITRKSTIKERQLIAGYFVKALELSRKTPLEENLMARVGFINDASTLTKKEAMDRYKMYLKNYPKGLHAEYISYRCVMLYREANDIAGAKKELMTFLRKYPDSRYVRILNDNMKQKKEKNKK